MRFLASYRLVGGLLRLMLRRFGTISPNATVPQRAKPLQTTVRC